MQLGACAGSLAQHSAHLPRARLLADWACQGVEGIAGPTAPELSIQLLGLARICFKQRDVEPGLLAVRRSIVLQEALTGPEHPDLIPHLNCLTDLLLIRAGKARRGEAGSRLGSGLLLEGTKLQTRCLRILRRSHGFTHLDSSAALVRTGHVFVRSGEHTLAVRAYGKALEIRTRLLGSQHPLTRFTRRLLDNGKKF